ncbi:MAG: 3-hydroxyacyl-CoA dehydrogenase PaaC [Gammaproteobacteria bacterium]|nr:3-hydroxyacyl-CoA dehydrogenase PaaC [Gammaproteobacteria bacterium]
MEALDSSQVIAVVGAGTMGSGIAQVAAKAGHPVLLYDAGAGAARKGRDKIAGGLAILVERGSMDEAERSEMLERISIVDGLAGLASAALVIEAIVEKLEIKQQVFAELEELCGDDVVLATNTSSLSISAIGADLSRPERLVGMHFFNPAPIMKLVEIVGGLATDRGIADSIFATAENWGKLAVHARSSPGFIVNRVARPFYAEGLRLLQEGAADVATIDAIMRDCGGFRMGPFELMDLIGLDVNYAVTESVHASYYGDQRFTPSLLQKELVDGGFLGRKSGRGFYDYADGADKPAPADCAVKPAPDAVTMHGESPFKQALVNLCSAAGIGIEQQPGDDFAIVCGDATLCLTDGRMATVRALEDDIENLVLFDLALDYESTPRIAICKADNASAAVLDAATGFWQKLGKQVSLLDDVAGLCVMRSVCMLANEAADAINQQVCGMAAVDTAMQGGLNYPRGPLAWADAVGLDHVLEVLDNLGQNYGEDRYRASPLLIRRVAGGKNFHE